MQKIINSPLGILGIETDATSLLRITFSPPSYNFITEYGEELIAIIQTQILQYFANPNTKFTIPIKPEGTKFQQKIWQELLTISPGETKTYMDIAKKLATSPRAVGNACRANPIPIIIPCHRVVAKNGLGGFGGACTGKLLAIKKWLQTHEQQNS